MIFKGWTAWGGRVVFVFIALFIASPGVWAQVAPAEQRLIDRQINQIQQREQQRLDEWDKEHSQRGAAPGGLPAPPVPSQSEEPSSICFVLHSVTFTGADHLSEAEQKDLLAPYVGRCIQLAEADAIVRALTDLYGAKGAVTTRAYIPPQDVSSGHLQIIVVEGRIQGFRWNSDPADDKSEIVTAFPTEAGEVLNLRDLEQGIDQLNRLPSNDAKLKLIPGEQPGQTLIVIENQPKKPWRVSAGLDNSGQRSTGEIQESYTAELDDALGLNETIALRHGRDRLHNSSERSSRNWSLNTSIPWGYWELTSALSYMQYRSVVSGQNQSFQTWGVQRNAKVGLNRVIHRDDVGKTTAGLSLAYKSLGNDVVGARTDASSPKLSVLGASLDHAQRVMGGVLHGSLEYDAGLSAFGARNDESWPHSPKAEFTKYQADLSYGLPLSIGGLDWSWSSTAHGQWSTDSLYSTEQIAIGGQSSVRGYKDQVLQGNRGAYWRNELSVALPTGVEDIDQTFGVLRPFVGYDIGVIANFHPETAQPGKLSGWGAGARLVGPWWRGEFSYNWALSSPSIIEPRSHELALSFTLAY